MSAEVVFLGPSIDALPNVLKFTLLRMRVFVCAHLLQRLKDTSTEPSSLYLYWRELTLPMQVKHAVNESKRAVFNLNDASTSFGSFR